MSFNQPVVISINSHISATNYWRPAGFP